MPKNSPSLLPAPNEPILSRIIKHLDAQIDFNKSLAERAKKCSVQELYEIQISMFIDLSEKPEIVPNNQMTKIDRAELVRMINEENEENELLRARATAENINIDYLYLGICYAYKQRLETIKMIDSASLEKILSGFYAEKNIKKRAKKIVLQILSQNLEIPLMTEIMALKEMLKLLESQISPQCSRYIDEIDIKGVNGQLEVTSSGKLLFSKGSPLFELARGNLSNPELASLVRRCIEADNAILKHVYTADRHASYITFFEVLKVKYQLADEVTQYQQKMKIRLKEAESKNVLAVSEQTPIQEIKRDLNNKKTSEKTLVDEPQLETGLAAQTSVQVITEESSIKESKSETLSLKSEIETSQEKQLETEIAEEKKNEAIEDDPKEEVYVENDYRFFANKTKQPQSKPQEKKIELARNLLNLNKDQRDTVLQVFDLMKYTSIKLRALVSLAYAFKATFETTGANRCRIEMKNIYAHILVPRQALEKACNSATVTMHGGGHRGSKSQNCDSENAPNYLIDQFKAAFIRAGYTPINLGLDNETNEAMENGTHSL